MTEAGLAHVSGPAWPGCMRAGVIERKRCPHTALFEWPPVGMGRCIGECGMSGSAARLAAIDAVRGYQRPAAVFPVEESPGAIFGQNVFTRSVMEQRLPKPVFKSPTSTIEHLEAARSECRRRSRLRRCGTRQWSSGARRISRTSSSSNDRVSPWKARQLPYRRTTACRLPSSPARR